MSHWKVIAYPTSIENCHKLIDKLIAELNEQACKTSIPLADVKKFSLEFSDTPKGLNGGVSFGEEKCHRPPLAHGNELRGS